MLRGDPAHMEASLSGLSSLKDEEAPLYIQPHYKETYRLAIYALLCGGKEAYEDFLRAEQISHFLSQEEIFFILENAAVPVVEDEAEVTRPGPDEVNPSTYFPTESDEEVPDLDLGWPEGTQERADTSISLLFHPPRENTPTIKEVVRKQIQEARQVVAISMDVFTDVDIFKEIVSATLRGVVVYILLDDSQFRSFLTMSHRVGVNIQDLKNIRVRTVQGQQYQCQSGVKFHGVLEQKFILVDCRTVLYGTYSFTWSYEKINLSMVLVVTGQLVCSYDEEFRRLYARSTVPPVLSRERLSVPYLRDSVALTSPNSSQLSLHQLHMNPRLMPGMRSAPDDRFNNPPLLTRGLSMQDRLHQSHCPDMGNLVRGHSYGGELQKLHSVTRLRMGTRDLGTPERTGSNLMPTNRLSQQQLRHHTRYGADQNLIPFNSETSLHRWKIDSYFNESDLPLDASYDAISPMISPYSSHTGLNELQSQVIHNRSRDIKSRMEEMRLKRLSLQEYANLRQSQESLRSMYPSLERPKFGSSLRNLDKMQSVAELEPHAQNGGDVESTNQKINDPSKEGDKTERLQTYDWREPLTRTVSAAELDMKLNDPSLKLSHLQSSSIQHLRAMESLIEIPEEKDTSRINTSDKVVLDHGNEENLKDETVVPEENSVKSSSPEEPQCRDEARGSRGSIGKVANSSNAAKERKKSVENIPKILNTSTGSQPAVEGKSSHTEKRREEPTLQRKNSVRMKVQALLSSDEKKASKKEEKSLQRKASVRSQNPSGSSQPLRADHSQGSSGGQITKKGQSPSVSRSQHTGSPTDTEKSKSAFARLSPQRSSKRKTNPAAEQDRGSRSTLSDEGATVFETRREKAYSRYEYLLSTESRTTSMYPSDKDRGTSPSYGRHDSGYPMYQTQSSSENKLGKFMQRVGNLIGKNK
ncbi:protein FAM83B-like [Hippoglossus hippoglossus]|uniref:protein FAM83B-like n=1 Tax=Hippoglossus hippoglossus TaxID=8267 RepID=UPI00148D1864|nr:protein FAM83B-like [Hippoglossus hippoglossus]XP_034456999.1 protein FAM83B-like [Hippoglossus hippoglossus]